MRSTLKKLAFAIVLSFVTVVSVSAKEVYPTTVKELDASYQGSTYIIGSTRFDEKSTVTKEANETAITNELNLKEDITKDDVSTYYRSSIDGAWYKVVSDEQEQTSLEAVKEEALEAFISNLDIYYVNNEEKLLGFPYAYQETVDAILTDGVTFEEDMFVVPATIRNFAFQTVSGEVINVATENIVTEEGNLVYQKAPSIEHHIPEEIEVLTQATDYSFTLHANDYADHALEVTAKLVNTKGEEVELEIKNENGFSFVSIPKMDTTGTYKLVFEIKEEEILGTTEYEFEVVYTKETNTIAKVKSGNTYYAEDVFRVAELGLDEITLLTDVTTDDTNTLVFAKNITLDGNGHTITHTGNSNSSIMAKGEGVTVTLRNINIVVTSGNGAKALNVQGGATMNVETSVSIETASVGVIIIHKGSTLNFAGGVHATGEYAAISGNGSKGYEGTIINILEGANIISTDYAIYAPQDGEVNIAGGSLTANSVVGIKSGKLNITGGILVANGEYVEAPEIYSDGQNLSGDVVTVEVNDSYAGGQTDDNIEVNITGGTLVSEQGKVLRVVREEGNDTTIVVTGDYTVETPLPDGTVEYTQPISE